MRPLAATATWFIALLAAAAAPCTEAEEPAGATVRMSRSSLNAGGGVAMRSDPGGDAVARLDASIGQAAPVGISADTQPGVIDGAGFWTVAGGPIVLSQCHGDCNGDNAVTIDEVIRGVNITLGSLGIGDCAQLDRNGDLAVTVDELVAAVGNALNGCAA